VTTTVFQHEGWNRRATATAVFTDTEELLPMLAVRGTEQVVRLTEPDGHALYARGPTTQTQEALGAFGLSLSKYNTNAAGWVEDGLHGEELHRAADVVHYGARHMALRDGMWLQPEPLLYLGLTNGNLRSPVGYSGVYAGGDSNHWADLSGFEPFTQAAVKNGAEVLDVSPEMAKAINDTVAATETNVAEGGPPLLEFGVILNFNGEGGTIQPGGEVQAAGEGHGTVSGEGGAGSIHSHPKGVDAAGGPPWVRS
jgi:hypothetical protein